MYGDVYGETELGCGLSFRARAVAAAAGIGYTLWRDGSYRSSITLTNGAGKPLPLIMRPKQ